MSPGSGTSAPAATWVGSGDPRWERIRSTCRSQVDLRQNWLGAGSGWAETAVLPRNGRRVVNRRRRLDGGVPYLGRERVPHGLQERPQIILLRLAEGRRFVDDVLDVSADFGRKLAVDHGRLNDRPLGAASDLWRGSAPKGCAMSPTPVTLLLSASSRPSETSAWRMARLGAAALVWCGSAPRPAPRSHLRQRSIWCVVRGRGRGRGRPPGRGSATTPRPHQDQGKPRSGRGSRRYSVAAPETPKRPQEGVLAR